MFSRVAIVGSKKDFAARIIREAILQHWEFSETGDSVDETPVLKWDPGNAITKPPDVFLATIHEHSIFCEYLDDICEADLILMISRHRSESGAPAFLTHCTGNWTDAAEQGGQPRDVAHSSGRVLQAALQELNRQNVAAGLNFDVSLEATHHGPTTNRVPLAYLELGSTKYEWVNPTYAAVVANAVMDVAASINTLPEIQVYLGFGGPHYAPSFTRLALEAPACTSHIVPKYFIPEITADQVQQVIDRTVEPLAGFMLDWKGLTAGDRAHILPILTQFDKPVFRVDQFLKKIKGNKDAFS
ncbi:MAG TPA: D-aminoacyl-tRNA deacylase [Candidatus Lokiarchaeia archaeon]|nr:D-aminoacyl-tRNA deacylase [Candidatus Lokiarchaeia archaeon]